MIGRLQAYVQRLAGEIGERNIWQPAALAEAATYIAEAATYIESQWSEQDYVVTRQTHEVSGARCANLEATRTGVDEYP